MVSNKSVAVIGSGVTGMTTALCLSKAGYRTVVISKDGYSETTSAAAAAFWYPYKAEPIDKVSIWAQKSLSVFRELQSIPETGIVWQDFSVFIYPGDDLPWWQSIVDGFRSDGHLTELPIGQRRTCRFRVPIIDTSLYLGYLHRTLKALDVEFQTIELSSIDEAFDVAETVVNCSGIGAIKLVNDHDLHPARGQVVRIKRQSHHAPVVDLTQEPKLAHVTPRINDTILGGTYEAGEFSLEPDPQEVTAIIERCKSIFPALGNVTEADILGVSCGLRPVRSSVRVEREPVGRKRLFHNYGHGGAGFTLSWGCAEEICNLVREVG